MDLHRAKISACWFNRRIQKLRYRKNTGQDWSRILKWLRKKPTLSNFSVSHLLTSRIVLPGRCCYLLGASSCDSVHWALHPSPACQGGRRSHTFPEAPSQPVFPIGPYSTCRDLENLATCLQLRIQNLSPQDESTEEYPRWWTTSWVSVGRRDVAWTYELKYSKRGMEWGGKYYQAFTFPSSLLETGVTLGCRGKAGRHEKMEIHFIPFFLLSWFGLREIVCAWEPAFALPWISIVSSYNLCSSAPKKWAPGKYLPGKESRFKGSR